MWLVSISVMLAVVQWASSDGGSPRLPTRRIPPFFWASAVSVVPATSASDASASSTARRDGFSVMRHLQIVGEPIYHTDGGRWARRRQRRSRRLLAGAAPERARILVPQEKCDLRDGELAVEQERGRHFTAELGEQRRERRVASSRRWRAGGAGAAVRGARAGR